MQRNYNLDWIRVIAMTGVVLDHYICSLGSNILDKAGLQIGGGSVTIFFAISALLFGAKWAKSGYAPFDTVDFLKKRCLRIYIPLWIALIGILPFEFYIVDSASATTAVMNVVGLGGARPMGIAGHLWYITMLMMLYALFIVISRLRLDKIKWYWWFGTFVLLTIAYIALQGRITTYSKAGPPLFTFIGVLMFAKRKEALTPAKQYKWIVLTSAVCMIALSQYVYQVGWHDSHKALSIGSFIIAGFLSFLALNSTLKVSKPNKAISWVAGISYEIYLVHAPLISICGHFVDDKIIMTPIWILASLICAVLLNKISNNIISII